MPDPPASDGRPRKEPLEGARILVVDDQEDIRAFLLAVFADAGAEICEAEGGAEALETAKRLAPDLITLDLSMPGQDGIAAFCELRSNPATESIPVCVVTGHPQMRALIYERPARPPEGYMDKPVDPARLVATVRRILGQRRRKDSPGPAGASG